MPLRPALALGTRILVFGGLIGIATGKTPYPLFFVVATAAWSLFFEAAYWSTRSIELNRKLMPRVYVPKLTLILAAAIPALLEFAIMALFALGAASSTTTSVRTSGTSRSDSTRCSHRPDSF